MPVDVTGIPTSQIAVTQPSADSHQNLAQLVVPYSIAHPPKRVSPSVPFNQLTLPCPQEQLGESRRPGKLVVHARFHDGDLVGLPPPSPSSDGRFFTYSLGLARVHTGSQILTAVRFGCLCCLECVLDGGVEGALKHAWTISKVGEEVVGTTECNDCCVAAACIAAAAFVAFITCVAATAAAADVIVAEV